MKHSDWLRLNRQGESICTTLQQQGYQCRKHTRRLSWKILHEGYNYLLTWLPAPVGDWSLMPNDSNPAREQMWAIVQSALAPKPKQAMTYQRVQQPEDFSRPWAIVRLLPDLRRYTVARFFNRQDADDHHRFLHRYMPASEFEVVFDVPNSQLEDDVAHINT